MRIPRSAAQANVTALIYSGPLSQRIAFGLPRSQYVSIRYSERLAEAGVEPSVGSKGDSDDNALAETINGMYKAELIHRRAPWKKTCTQVHGVLFLPSRRSSINQVVQRACWLA